MEDLADQEGCKSNANDEGKKVKTGKRNPQNATKGADKEVEKHNE